MNGGGVLKLINNSVKFAEIEIKIKTMIEMQLIELSLGQNLFIAANVYMPPARARTIQTNEFKRVIQNVKNDFPLHQLIIVGDFNIPSAVWKINQETNDLHIENLKDLTQPAQPIV